MDECSSLRILEDLMLIPGPPTGEQKVVERFLSYIKEYVDEQHVDSMGNGWGVINPAGERTILFVAHADEIGLIVTNREKSKFVEAYPLGALPNDYAVGLPVQIHGKAQMVNGIIGRPAVHLVSREKPEKTRGPLYIDIGAKVPDTSSGLFSPGDLVSFARRIVLLQDRHICGGPVDNRAGLTSLVHAGNLLNGQRTAFRVILAASVQEETGYNGIRRLAHGLKPDLAVVVDVIPSADHPLNSDIEVNRLRIETGRGPVIHIGPATDRNLAYAMLSLARRQSHQVWVDEGATPTEATAISHLSPSTQVGIIGIPCRYTHSFYELASLDDIEETGSLIAEIARSVEI